MLRNKLIIGFYGLLLTGCGQGELPASPEALDNYIRFSAPAVTVETRSTTQDALGTGDRFGVLGYCVPYMMGTTTPQYSAGASEWGVKYNLCPPNVFYNEPVTVADSYCSYNNPKQWYRDGYGLDGQPNEEVSNADNYRYTFFAYYPYRDAGSEVFRIESPANNATAGAPDIVFSMPQTGGDTSTPLDHAATPDAMFGVLYNRQKSQGSLQFSFSHMLTALGFEVNNFSDYDLQVHSVTLSGSFFKEIKLDFSGTGTLAYSFPETYYSGTYTLYNDGQSLSLSPPAEGEDRTTSGLLPRNAAGEGEYILLISGKEPYFGNNVQVTIDYTFNEKKNTQHFSRPDTFVPQPGTKYTAQLNFVGNAFVLQFVVDNNEQWEDGGADNDPDADNDEDGDGDVIFE